MKILAVDDDEVILTFINCILKMDSHEVVNAHCFDEALSVMEDNKFDMVITDIVMPGKDGTELMKHIRSEGYTMPIVAITGGIENASEDYLNYANLFSDRSLSKPFHQSELLETVHRLDKAA